MKIEKTKEEKHYSYIMSRLLVKRGITMKKNTVKALVTLCKSKFLSFYEARYENKEGKEKKWLMASRKTEEVLYRQFFEGQEEQADAVLIAAIHEESKKLVLIKQFRIPLNDYIYELPAGLIDEGEDYKEAACRELKEETGLELVNINEYRSVEKVYLSAGMTDESVGMVYGTCKGALSSRYMEADEDIIPMLVSKEEAKNILQSGKKLDIKAYMVLQAYVQSVLEIE